MSRILILAYRGFSHDARLLRNAEALVRRGDSVDVICLEIEGDRYSGPVNVIRVRVPRYRGKSRSQYFIRYALFLCRAFMTATRRSLGRRYDLVMAMSMPDATVFGCLGAKLFGSKVVLDITDMMPELYRDRFGVRRWDVGGKLLHLEERLSARAADLVLAVHELHRRRLESAGINPSKIRVVMNSPDPTVFRPVEKKRSKDDGEFIVMYHGSLIRRLGIDIAIRAIAIARHSIPGLRLRILGTGDYLEEAQTLVKRLSLHNYVAFHGFLPVQEVVQYAADADVGLVPYRLNDATRNMLPLKLLEYVSLSVPVISARLEAVEF